MPDNNTPSFKLTLTVGGRSPSEWLGHEVDDSVKMRIHRKLNRSTLLEIGLPLGAEKMARLGEKVEVKDDKKVVFRGVITEVLYDSQPKSGKFLSEGTDSCLTVIAQDKLFTMAIAPAHRANSWGKGESAMSVLNYLCNENVVADDDLSKQLTKELVFDDDRKFFARWRRTQVLIEELSRLAGFWFWWNPEDGKLHLQVLSSSAQSATKQKYELTKNKYEFLGRASIRQGRKLVASQVRTSGIDWKDGYKAELLDDDTAADAARKSFLTHVEGHEVVLDQQSVPVECARVLANAEYLRRALMVRGEAYLPFKFQVGDQKDFKFTNLELGDTLVIDTENSVDSHNRAYEHPFDGEYFITSLEFSCNGRGYVDKLCKIGLARDTHKNADKNYQVASQ